MLGALRLWLGMWLSSSKSPIKLRLNTHHMQIWWPAEGLLTSSGAWPEFRPAEVSEYFRYPKVVICCLHIMPVTGVDEEKMLMLS